MPVIKVNDYEYSYLDSGVPVCANYKTIVLIHGHTFHSGLFRRLLPLATANNFRIIFFNRRQYPGSTPYTAEELKIFAEGSEAERAKLMQQQGYDIGLFVNGLMKELCLSEEGGITLAAWSLGVVYLLSLLCSINLLPEGAKKQLTKSVKEIIIWDPPSHALGIKSPPGSYVPLWDVELSDEARPKAFGVWLASYYKHGDLSARDFKALEQRNADKSKTNTFDNMTLDELLSTVDFTAGDKCDTITVAPEFAQILRDLVHKSLFDPAIVEAWKSAKFSHIYGEHNAWNVLFAVWNMEEWAKTSKVPIDFKAMNGANHFVMWEDPDVAFNTIKSCINL